MNKALPSPETLRQFVRYEPDTGMLYWKERTPSDFSDACKGGRVHAMQVWNKQNAGNFAFRVTDGHGYFQGSLKKKMMKAHRVAWVIQYGAWPSDDIDHINGDRSDNRIVNLREATRSQNAANAKKRAGTSSKHRGVHWDKRSKKWRAEICSSGVRTRLGRFHTEQEAHDAYCAAAKSTHGNFRRKV